MKMEFQGFSSFLGSEEVQLTIFMIIFRECLESPWKMEVGKVGKEFVLLRTGLPGAGLAAAAAGENEHHGVL